jgi:hypothetical protein
MSFGGNNTFGENVSCSHKRLTVIELQVVGNRTWLHDQIGFNLRALITLLWSG